tara:strand:- start:1040 stop:1279 length:240 start_codon:yes stop_codon:yes gene_type:complete
MIAFNFYFLIKQSINSVSMPLTKASYKLPKRNKSADKKSKKKQRRLELENKRLALRAAQGSFVVFREKGLEDVFVVDDL